MGQQQILRLSDVRRKKTTANAGKLNLKKDYILQAEMETKLSMYEIIRQKHLDVAIMGGMG
jgi:hypothetical protein